MKPPLGFKVGVAISLSVAGYLCSYLSSGRGVDGGRTRYHPRIAGGGGGGGGRGLKDEQLFRLQLDDATSDTSDDLSTAMISSAISIISPGAGGKNLEEEEERLLAEFDALMRQGFGQDELDMVAPPSKSIAEEQEVAVLKSLIRSLQERESSLEILMLEYYGLREQEAAVMELENRLKIREMEAELLSVKIESLQSENRRLQAVVARGGDPGVKAELDSSRANIKFLKKKMKMESARSKEKIAALHEAIRTLQDDDAEERMSRKMKDLEDEAAELRGANSMLATENLDLMRRLETAQLILVPSNQLESTDHQAKGMSEEEQIRLRQENDELAQRMEQLQMDRCSDIEELVYLRWVNACLRYELRNYRPPPGTTVARDLSRTLSPRSEHKVKQLILHYANGAAGGIDERKVGVVDFDSEYCSSPSQASSSGGANDPPTGAPTAPTRNAAASGKKKLFAKIKRLVLGRDVQDQKLRPPDASPTSCSTPAGRRFSASTCSLDDMIEWNSYDDRPPWARDLSRVSFDFQRLISSNDADDGDSKSHAAEASCSASGHV